MWILPAKNAVNHRFSHRFSHQTNGLSTVFVGTIFLKLSESKDFPLAIKKWRTTSCFAAIFKVFDKFHAFWKHFVFCPKDVFSDIFQKSSGPWISFQKSWSDLFQKNKTLIYRNLLDWKVSIVWYLAMCQYRPYESGDEHP